MPKVNNAITYQTDERVFICGQTGSGKTVLAKQSLKHITRLIVIDTKGELTDWNTEEFEDVSVKQAITRGDPVRARVIPPLRGDKEDYFDDIFFMAYDAGNITVYIDEMYGVVLPGKNPPDGLSALYTRGRSRGVGVVSCSQRPTWVPLFAMSEAKHFFMFRLNMPEDRDRVAEVAGQPVMQSVIRDKYGFFYYENGADEAHYIPGLVIKKSKNEESENVPV